MYPTKEQILKKDPHIKMFVKEIILCWKKENTKDWRSIPNEGKIERLKYLILGIMTICYPSKKWPHIIDSNAYYYVPTAFEIHQDVNKPSIISALHELGHHLYGPSELKACRWSIYLFRTCFPEMYKKLKWSNHLLIK